MSTDEFDLTFADGFVTPGRRRNNWIGSNTPTSADGAAYLWEIGSQWVSGSNTWICTDPTQGTAVWTQTDVAGGGGMTNPMTTAGDIIYAIASGVPERLGKGTDGQFLQTSNSLVSWASAAGHAQSHDHSAAGDGTALAPVTVTATGNIVSRGELRSKDNAAGDFPGVVGLYNPLNPAVADTKGGTVEWYAKDTGGTDRPIGSIYADVSANVGVDDLETRMVFSTRGNGDSALVERWGINNEGDWRPLTPGVYKLGAIANPALEVIAGAHSDTASDTGRLDFYKRSASGGAVADTHVLGNTRYYGDDGTGDIVGASIRAVVDGTVATNDMPTYLAFATNEGAAAATTRWRMTPAGHLEPGADSTYDIGLTAVRPATVYADKVETPEVDSAAALLELGPTATSVQFRGQIVMTADASKQFRPFAAEDGNWDLGGASASWADLHLSGVLRLGSVQVLSGSGTPESVVTAPVGSMFLRSDGGAGTSMYIKESGTGNTGWIGK